MYYHRPRRSHLKKNKHRAVDYVMPFLIIICVGIIVVLAFNLIRALFSTDNTKAAYLHIVNGSAEMKAWRTDDFFNLNTDISVMQGDEIRSSADAQIIVEFFDGTIMRMDANTTVEFNSIVDDKNSSEIDLRLKEGSVWFNKLYKDTAEFTNLVVTTKNIKVNSNLASVFEVQSEDAEAVRVFGVFENEGLLVDVLNEDASKVVESENVGVGQEIVFNAAVLDRYWKYQSPTVLSAVSDAFKESMWYVWNFSEDASPTQFEKSAGMENVGLIKVNPEISKDEPVVDEVVADEVVTDIDAVVNPVVLSSLAKPVVTSVSGGSQVDENGFYKVGGSVATLAGNVSGATKVVVNGYVLQKFVPASGAWTYYANADYGLMKQGENSYEIHAEDANGNKSESLIVKVFYAPAAPVIKEEAPVSEPSEPVSDDAVVEDPVL